jgi:hypothetical protein
MHNLFEAVQDFICESNIQFNPKKCELLKIGNDNNMEFIIKDKKTGEFNSLDCQDKTKIIRYLDAPLGKGKVTKMKWCENQLIKMLTKATILAESGLKTSQVIDGIKTFIIPMVEFLLRHSNVSLTKLGSLDDNLRRLINIKLDGLKVTKDTFYLRARDSGFGLLSLKDRYHICKIANIGHLLSSSIGATYRRHITQVGIDRHVPMLNTVEEVATSRFFTCKPMLVTK